MRAWCFLKKPAPDPELEDLKAELAAAQGDLQAAYNQFDLVVEPELVESCIYQINAIQARCNYLIRAIKEREPEATESALGATDSALAEEERRMQEQMKRMMDGMNNILGYDGHPQGDRE